MMRRWFGPAALAACWWCWVQVLTQTTAADESKANDKKDGWVQLLQRQGPDRLEDARQAEPGAIKEIVKVEKDGKVVAYEGKLKKDDKQVPLWRVEDGILIGSGPSSHLFSERGDYENFRYRVEAMINDNGNSGQYFRTEFGPGFPKGYEAQINATHGDPIRTGSLYPSFELSQGGPQEDPGAEERRTSPTSGSRRK